MAKKKNNRLRLARKRLGYGGKKIAQLIGYTYGHLWRFEVGQQIPSFEVAVKLAILYKLPIRVLFQSFFEKCRGELEVQMKTMEGSIKLESDLTVPSDYCSYIELMNSPFMTDTEAEKVRRHITLLMTDRRQTILDE